jgi:hypothetical protein
MELAYEVEKQWHMEQLITVPIVLSSADLVLKVPHKGLNLQTPNEVMSKNIQRTRELLT